MFMILILSYVLFNFILFILLIIIIYYKIKNLKFDIFVNKIIKILELKKSFKI